jgi:hypothetical protein
VNLHLVQGAVAPYDSLQESIAIQAWRKMQRIDLYRTIAICTASANPAQSQQAIRRLIEEQFPEVGKEREDAVDRAMAIMEKETERAYTVAPVGGTLNKGGMGRLQNILKTRSRGRSSRSH